MGIRKYLKYLDYIFLVATGCLFVFGSVQKYGKYSLPASIALTFFIIGVWLVQGKKIKLPKNFILYLIFLIVLVAHILIFKGDTTYFLLFLSSGLYWLVSANLKEDYLQKLFFPFLVFFGFLMAALYLGFLVSGVNSLGSGSLFLPLYKSTLHNHLGDVWAIILVGVIYKMFQKKEKWQIPLLIFGLLIILQSLSRSAVVSLAVGSFYVYYKEGRGVGSKKIFALVLAATVIMFIFSSTFKTTLFSRPYIAEGINSFLVSPLGIGVGKFGDISKESALAHNIILEILAGMGIFSFIFIYWLIKVFKFLKTQGISVLYSAVFLAIFANFFFDTTYTIPTMVWLWFITLGLIF